MPLLQVDNVCYSYPGPGGVEALRHISFDVEENEFVSIIGPSGCGKSTFLRLAADLLPVTSGRIEFDGKPPSAARQRREIGFVFQEPALMPWRSALKNVRLPLELLGRDSGGRQVGTELLALVGLQDFAEKRPDQLSGGMRQRVSIARALTYDPRLLLMDEPFGALDQITRDEMNQELLNVWERKRNTVVFVTHSISEAVYLSDRVITLSARPGSIVDVVDVGFPRPRHSGIKRLPEFIELETRLLQALEGRRPDG